MEFEWDERKRKSNLDKHGVDLLNAVLIFEGHLSTRVDDRHDYGERRLISIGMVGEECYVVVHVEREGRVRLISSWKGGRDEHAAYQESLSRRDQGDEGSW